MKILYITTIGATMVFFESFIESLIKQGYIVEIATNEADWEVPKFYRDLGCKIHPISTSRSPLNKGNLRAIGEIKRIVKDGNFDLVHCHTPNAAVVTRLACKGLRKNGLKVFYTAHGFHFYKGAPKLNWLVFYPVEKFCSRFTDKLITINQEDYNLAKSKFHAKEVCYVPGVGIDLSRFENVEVDRADKRREIGVPEDAFLLLSVGELNENKNHQVVVKALSKIRNSNIHYAIAGVGDKNEYLVNLAKELGVESQVHLLGYRKDIPELYRSANVFVLPSIREGLNVSLMEAMASGLPCIAGSIRGNVDLVDEDGGVLFCPNSLDDCSDAITSVVNSDAAQMCAYNLRKIKSFGLENIINKMNEVYNIGKI